MISKKMRAGSDIVDSSSHFPMIGAQLCVYAEVGKVTLRSNSDEALSNESLFKSNSNEALNNYFP